MQQKELMMTIDFPIFGLVFFLLSDDERQAVE